jgi:hypothetical protein
MAAVLPSVGTLYYYALHIAVASEDAAGGILMVQFSTDHLLTAVPPQVNLSREEHPEWWGREVNPQRCPGCPLPEPEKGQSDRWV